MMEASATVVDVGEGFAWIETQRRSSCTQCASSASCGVSWLSRWFRPTHERLRIADTLGLKAGERVVIGIADATLIRAALMAYVLPLITLIGASGLATGLQLGEGLVALAGLAGLALGLWLARRLTGGTRGQERYRPTLIGREMSANRIPLADLTHVGAPPNPGSASSR